MRTILAAVSIAAALAAPPLARGAGSRLAPIPRDEALSTHGPWEMGACRECHERGDPAASGPLRKPADALCLDCHDEFKGAEPVRLDAAVHPEPKARCSDCHNPHNARKKKLLL